MDRAPAWADRAVRDFETWRSLVRDTFFAAELERPDDRSFAARLTHKPLGAMDLARIEATPHNFRRTADDVARHGTDVYDVVLVLDGRGAARQGSAGGPLGRGHLVISDTTRPYQIDFDSPFHLAQLVLPRGMLGAEPDHVARVTGRPVDTSRGTAALLADLLTRVTEPADDGPPGSPAGEPHVADAVASLCRAVTAELLAEAPPTAAAEEDGTPATEAQRRALRARIVAWIEEHLHEPALDPAAIAGSHFISTRYLHLLFEDHPVSVARHVRERRLDRIRRDLAAPGCAGTPISAVAARWGIGDAARFSRLFRERYGVSPSAYRTAARTGWTRHAGSA